MTPCNQLTDTDVVFPVKGAAKGTEDDLRREMKSIGHEKGVRPQWTCGPYEILRISGEAIAKSRPQFDNGRILAAGVRNGQLSWRPDLKKGCLVRSDEQQWCQDLRVQEVRLNKLQQCESGKIEQWEMERRS